jgi:hypothetical protein
MAICGRKITVGSTGDLPDTDCLKTFLRKKGSGLIQDALSSQVMIVSSNSHLPCSILSNKHLY